MSVEPLRTSTTMSAVRVLLGGVGVVVALVGVRDLLDPGWASLRPVLVWLVVGNVLHDAVLVPLVLVSGAILARVAPGWARGPLVAGLVVLGATTLLAVPVLGMFGAELSNPSLMPRNYWLGWAVLLALVTVAVVLAAAWRLRRDGTITRLQRSQSRTVRAADPGGSEEEGGS